MTKSEKNRASALERFLKLFTDVRPGEGATALLLALNIFLILTAYYILKPVREALILGQGSAELKSYLAGGQVFMLAVLVPLYGRLSNRVSRRRLINVVTAIFIACLIAFYVLAQAGVPLSIVFFLWIGIFNLMIPAQFWSFANDVYTKDEGERLFPIVAFGASLGAVAGASIAAVLIAQLGVYQMMLVAAVLLFVQVVVTNHLDRKESAREKARIPETPVLAAEHAREEQKPSGGTFALVFRTRYLLLMALMLACLNWVNTTGEYILGSVVADGARQAVAAGEAGGLSVEQYIGQFYSRFFGVVNVAGVLIQLFLVSRIVKYFGVHIGVLMLPVIAFGAYGILAFYPVLSVVRWAKTAENSIDYSLNNTVRNMLFLPCTREQKYAGKQVIDSFFVRAGDVLSALLVFVGTSYFALTATGFAKFNLALVMLWLCFAFFIGRQYKQVVATGQAPR